MPARALRRPTFVAALVAAATLGLTACFGGGAPDPGPPATDPGGSPTTTTTTPPAGGTCQAVETLSLESASPAAIAYEAVVEDGGGESEYVRFEAVDGAEFAAQVDRIEATVGEVHQVSEETPVGILEVNPSDDPRYNPTKQQPALDQVNFDDAWANGEDGDGIVVAVVDTGVQADHTDLVDNVLPGADFVDTSGGACSDPHGHGTHVAGIVGQVDNTIGGIGGAPAVSILPVRVLNSGGTGTPTAIAAGIDWAVANHADVINLSLGGSQSTSITNAVNAAVASGVTVVAAAGNCGGVSGPTAQCPSGLNMTFYPAALDNVIAVGALDTGTTMKATFSNNNTYIDITTPGTFIDSTVPPNLYDSMSGTSMSTPFVSAIAALIRRDCVMTPAEVLSKIVGSATQSVTDFEEIELLADAAAAAADCDLI